MHKQNTKINKAQNINTPYRVSALGFVRFGIYLGFVILCFVSFVNIANAALIIQAPKYIGLTSGLVGYWSFDESTHGTTSVADLSGNNNRGFMINGPQKAIGKIGQGINFDGSNDYVDAGDIAIHEPASITVSAWVKPSGTQTAFGKVLIKGDGGAAYFGSYKFEFSDTDYTTLRWVIGFTDVTTKTININPIVDGQWQHIVGTYDGTKSRAYLNGVEKPSGSTSAKTIQYDAVGLTIGSAPGYAPFNGSIDDVRVYNRALSPDEIKRLYNIGR